MASKSGELRVTLLGAALLGLLLLSQHAAPVDAAESVDATEGAAAAAGVKKTSFSFNDDNNNNNNNAGGRTLSSFSMSSFSMNSGSGGEKKPSGKGV